MADRLRESELVNDARVRVAGSALSADELRILRHLSKLGADQARDLTLSGLGMISNPDQRGLDGLVAKGCVQSIAENVETGGVFFALTPFGFALAGYVKDKLIRVNPKVPGAGEADTARGA